MDEKNETANSTFGNTRAESLRFGGFEYVVHLL